MRKKNSKWILAALAMVAIAALAYLLLRDPEYKYGTLEGYVRNAETKEAAWGVTVKAIEINGHTTSRYEDTTGQDGYFEISLKAGEYILQFESEGYQFYETSESWEVISENVTSIEDIELEPLTITSEILPDSSDSSANSQPVAQDNSSEEATSSVSETEQTDATSPTVETDYSDEYIFPDSDVIRLDANDLQRLSGYELRIARNEIAARHGRMFKDPELQAYFNEKSWYTPSISPEDFDANIDSILNKTEKYNMELIKEFES